MSKERRLAPDFSYSTPYTTDADPGLATIHAYSDQAAERKRRFLHDAAQLLLAIGRELREYGFTASEVRTNEAGVAVSGEVYGHYGQDLGERDLPHRRHHLPGHRRAAAAARRTPERGVRHDHSSGRSRHRRPLVRPPPEGARLGSNGSERLLRR